MKFLRISSALCLLAFVVTTSWEWVTFQGQEVLFESRESKTPNQDAVFNRIKLIKLSNGSDAWLMNQSHHGLNATSGKWDRLAIVIDKKAKPKLARFYQLEPGSLNLKSLDEAAEIPRKAACFLCHNNGTRAIRPNFDSHTVGPSLADRLTIVLWNLKIKSYGRVLTVGVNRELDKSSKESSATLKMTQNELPLRHLGSIENEPLTLPVCLKCHNEDGWIARGQLIKQQAATIRFLVNSGEMPPFGIKLNTIEQKALERFVSGL